MLAAGSFLLLAGACSTDAATKLPLAPQDGVVLSRVPTRSSPNYGSPDLEYVEACLNKASRVPATVIEVVIDIGNDGGNDALYKYPIVPGQCIDVWLQGGSQFDAVRVDVGKQNFQNATNVVSVNNNGVMTILPPASGSSVTGLLVNGRTGSNVDFTVF